MMHDPYQTYAVLGALQGSSLLPQMGLNPLAAAGVAGIGFPGAIPQQQFQQGIPCYGLANLIPQLQLAAILASQGIHQQGWHNPAAILQNPLLGLQQNPLLGLQQNPLLGLQQNPLLGVQQNPFVNPMLAQQGQGQYPQIGYAGLPFGPAGYPLAPQTWVGQPAGIYGQPYPAFGQTGGRGF